MRRDDLPSTSIQRHFGTICPLELLCQTANNILLKRIATLKREATLSYHILVVGLFYTIIIKLFIFFQLSFTELLHFIERNGVSLQECFLSYQRKEIKGLYSFFDTLQSALLTNLRRLIIEVIQVKFVKHDKIHYL